MAANSNARYAEPVQNLMNLIGKLPGIGTRSAERITFHLLKEKPEVALALSDALRYVVEHVRHCSVCFNLTEPDPCGICTDPARDQGVVCVVEQPKDLIQLESTNIYKGAYHVLLGHIAPLQSIGPEDLTIPHLIERVKKSHAEGRTPIREVILATNPTTEGDGTALYIQNALAPLGVAITRLARGLPAGAQIEYSNKAILADAITGRVKF